MKNKLNGDKRPSNASNERNEKLKNKRHFSVEEDNEMMGQMLGEFYSLNGSYLLEAMNHILKWYVGDIIHLDGLRY